MDLPSTQAPRAAAATPDADTNQDVDGDAILQLQGVGKRFRSVDGHERTVLDSVDFTLHDGEIVALLGASGSGNSTLLRIMAGLIPADAGTVTVAGQPLPARPQAWVAAGVARIPEDRHAVGVVGDLPLWQNAVLEHYPSKSFSRWGLLRRAAARAFAQGLVQRFDVRGTESAGVATLTRSLSGGNMQKLILGRALAGDPGRSGAPPLIVANQPTWGLDIGAVAYVHRQLLDACAAGAALLLISEDLDEVFALADRIAVMHHGRLTPPRPTADWTLAAIGLAMAGSDATSPTPGPAPPPASTTPPTPPHRPPDPIPHAT